VAGVRGLLAALARGASEPSPTALATATAAALVAIAGVVSADSLWLAAIGHTIVETASIPTGVPYAAADSSGWPNALVLSEVWVYLLDSGLGAHGLLLAQIAAVAACFTLVGLDMQRGGATGASAGAALLFLVPPAFSSLVAIRVQLFSLPLFALLALLLRTETRAPSRRIWLLVPLIALWSNLHGAVLVGFAAVGAYLLLERVRRAPATALGVLVACAAALCLTPALLRTPEYFQGVLENEAARRGVGLWARLSLTTPVDIVLVAGAIILVAVALKARPSPWELAVIAGLALLTARTGRSGIWLLLFAAVPAARAIPLRENVRPRVAAAALAVLGGVVGVGLVRGPLTTGAGDRLVAEAVTEAAGTPILADPLLGEQVALAGGKIWVGNPLDAFALADQRLYLDWIEGSPDGDDGLAHSPRVVFVQPGGDAQARLARRGDFREADRDANAVLYVRTGSP
jgi:hypothetical protein